MAATIAARNYMMPGANRTPGLWQSTLGKSLYDGINTNNGDANGDGKPDGNKDFDAEGWSTTDLPIKYGVLNDTKFAIHDKDGDGQYDAGDDIFLTFQQLAKWVGGTGDGLKMLERDVGATFLNTINNHSLTTPEENNVVNLNLFGAMQNDIEDSYLGAVQFILKWDSNFDGNVDGGNKNAMKSEYQANIAWHTELAAYNESGEASSGFGLKQIAMDGDDYSSALVQNYLYVQQNLIG